MAGGVSPTWSKSVITDEIKVRKRFTDIALYLVLLMLVNVTESRALLR